MCGLQIQPTQKNLPFLTACLRISDLPNQHPLIQPICDPSPYTNSLKYIDPTGSLSLVKPGVIGSVNGSDLQFHMHKF